MTPSNSITPERQFVYHRIVDIVGRIESNDGGKEGPCAERAGGEFCHRVRFVGGRDLTRVYSGRSFGGNVVLHGVAARDQGDLENVRGFALGLIEGERTHEKEPVGQVPLLLRKVREKR